MDESISNGGSHLRHIGWKTKAIFRQQGVLQFSWRGKKKHTQVEGRGGHRIINTESQDEFDFNLKSHGEQ